MFAGGGGGGRGYWFSFLAKGQKDTISWIYVAVVSAKLNINQKLNKG